MLVLRRRVGESVLIGAGIEVEIVDISPTRVKLGIRAPDEVTILRKELKIASDQNQAAAETMGQVDVEALVRRFQALRPE